MRKYMFIKIDVLEIYAVPQMAPENRATRSVCKIS